MSDKAEEKRAMRGGSTEELSLPRIWTKKRLKPRSVEQGGIILVISY